MENLNNKVAIITGATGGIGKATAQLLSQEGVKLVLTGRSQEKLNTLTSELKNAVGIAGDITAPHLPATLVQKALDEFGQLDILFNNAGIMIVSDIEQADIEAMCLMIRVNVEAMIRMGYTAMKHFAKQKQGFLINTSSISGLKPYAGTSAYSASKFAVEAFTDGLRQDAAPLNQQGAKIGVACIQPGPVFTGLMDDFPDGVREAFTGTGALKPIDIAKQVKHILQQPDGMLIPRMLMLPSGLAF